VGLRAVVRQPRPHRPRRRHRRQHQHLPRLRDGRGAARLRPARRLLRRPHHPRGLLAVSTTDTTAARLDISFDGLPWVIGPTESRPFDAWLPEALAVMEQILQVPQGEPRMREYVEAVLRRV